MNSKQPPDQSFHRLLGEHMSLDFVNTLDWRGRAEPEESLNTYQDLIQWCLHVNILSKREAELLSKRSKMNSAEAKKTLALAWDLRESLYSIFSAAAEGKAPLQQDLIRFNSFLIRAGIHSKITWKDHRFAWHSEDNKDSLDWIINPIVRSAAELLVSFDLKKVRGCGDRECGWLFLDTSRNQSRRWCDMQDCGNRAKARRFYSRKKIST